VTAPGRGRLVTETLDFAGGRRVTAYVPPKAPEAVVFAGDGRLISAWGVTLEAAGLPPTMIVGAHRAADEVARLHEYSIGFDADRFAAHETFFVERLREWARSRWGVVLPAARTAVCGVSAGGEFALAMGLRHPDIYGAVFCASPGGGYRPPDVMPTSLPRAYLVAGAQEPFFLENATRWAAALRAAGADVVLAERAGAHGEAWWREEFPLMVSWAFGPRGADGALPTPSRPEDPASVSRMSLRTHLQVRYGISVTDVSVLDADVFRVDRSDGPSWVARVFPAERPVADIGAEAELLQVLEQAGFPAERCGDAEPVSSLGDRGVLVTDYVIPAAPLTAGRTAALLGGMLGALHSRTPPRLRPGGAWHHLSGTGGPREEIAAAAKLLDDALAQVPARQLGMFDRLREAVARADDCEDLPHALTHPDPVAANAIPTPEQRLVLVDWTGAGRGPRLWSLGWLLWVAGAVHPRLVELVASRYGKRVSLEPEELTRLAGAIAGRPLMLDCWSFCHGRRSLSETVERMDADRRSAERIAQLARQSFSSVRRPSAPPRRAPGSAR
jgi:Ser/Thr protein kinase RdoA (MazF antagonist)/predicted esterase